MTIKFETQIYFLKTRYVSIGQFSSLYNVATYTQYYVILALWLLVSVNI